MADYEHARQLMVEEQILRRGIGDQRVLAAMRAVPRECFVEPGYEKFAYDDAPLPIAQGQTISQPYIVALMLEAARIGPGDSVLEIGTGSGYAAAVMARLARRVFSIERHEALGRAAERRLRALKVENIEIRIADGSKGWPERAPFEAIVVAAGAPAMPPALQAQLTIGGRLVIPIGDAERNQRLLRIGRVAADRFDTEDLGGVKFVPLVAGRD